MLPSLLPGAPFTEPTTEEFSLPVMETLIRIRERMERGGRLLPDGPPLRAHLCRQEYGAAMNLALNLERALLHGDRR